MRPLRSAKRAVTLIETLAVIVLLALATAVLARGVTASSPERELQQALRAISELDGTGRSMARSSGPLRVRATGDKLIASVFGDEAVVQRTLPDGWTIESSNWSQHDWLYVIDSAGRSGDVELVITGPNDRHEIRIDGLLGSVRMGEFP